MNRITNPFSKTAAGAFAIAVLMLTGAGAAHAQTAFSRDLTMGSSGADVSALQTWLIGKGFSIPAGATGYFGAQTRTALAAYQAANGIMPAAGYFGPITRSKVAADGSVTTPQPAPGTPSTGTLKGGEADLSDYELKRENSSGAEGEQEVDAATVSFDVDDGDVRVERFELTVKATDTNLNQQPWKYFDAITITADGKEVAQEDVDSRSDWSKQGDGSYRLTLSGLKHIVREGDTAELTIAFDINDSIDSADLAQEFDLSIGDRGIRAVDAAGIQQYIGGATEKVSFGFDAEENGDLSIASSKDDPETSILVADENRESSKYEVFAFDLKNKDDVDTLITDLRINVTDLNSGVSASDVIRRATLTIGRDSFDGEVSASAIDFEDMDFEIGGDDEESVMLEITLARNATATPIAFSVTASDIDAEGVRSGNTAQVSGTQTSETHTIAFAGVQVSPVSTSQTVVTPGDDASSTYGSFTIKFKVAALEEDAYIATTTATSGTAGVVYGIGGNSFTGTSSAVLSSTARNDGGFYQVREGKTETFTLTVTLDPSAGGIYDLRLNSLFFNDSASLVGATEYNLPTTSDYRSDPIYIAN